MEKEKDQKAQSERFIKKAKELGVDESGEVFERAFKKVASHKSLKTTKDTGEHNS